MAGINNKIGSISSKVHYPYEGIFGKASPGPSYIIKEATGNGYINLTNAVANHLMELKAYGGIEQRDLPKGYTQYEYLRSNGTQYIDLGYKGNGDTKVEVKFKYHTATSATGSGRVFGSRTTSSSNAFAIGTSSGIVSATNNKVFWCYDGQSFYVSDNTFGLDERNTIIFSATEHKINGTTEGDDYTVAEFETPSNLMLFAFDNNGTVGVGYVDIAYCKLWNNGVLVRDLIPVKNASNVIGMYDLITGNLLTNDGTGTFETGNTATPTPEKPMDIVCNNGKIKFSKNMANVNSQTALVGYYISSQGVVTADTYNRIYQEFIPVKPNTTYTLSMSSSVYYVSISEYSTAEDSGFIVRKPGITGSNTSLTITTGATTNYVRFGANLNRVAVTMARVLAIDWQLERGDTPTPYHEYVEGGLYIDGITEMIWSHGKNLYDKNTALLGDIATNGDYTSRTYRVISDYIPVRYGQTFVGSGTLYDTNGDNYSAQVIKAFYKADKSYITGSRGSVTGNKFTIDDNECAYIRIVFFNISLVAGKTASIENSVLQLEEGATATTYEPYYNGGKATAEMLLKVGTYQDEQEILSGNITRKVGIKVLDGTETFTVSSTNAMIISIPDVSIGAENIPMNTHFALETSATSIAVGKQRFGANGTKIYSTNYYMKHTTITTASDFKAWLSDQYNAGTPVIIVYPLATSTTESVAGQTMNIPAGDSTIEITQASIENLGLYAKYKATA